MILNEQELKNISGGKVTASYLNAIIRGVTFLTDLGRSLGTAIRRIQTGRICSL